MLKKNFILDVGITNATKQEVLEYIIKGLGKKANKYFIVTPNPEFLVLASKAKEYKKILNNAKVALPDGIGVIIAGIVLGIRFKERITGVEVLESLCEAVAKKPITVGFLGGRQGIAEKTAECLINHYPNLDVVFAAGEWSKEGFGFQKKNQESRIKNQELETKNKKNKIRNSLFIIHDSIDILFVAFGAPKQEMWINENLDKLPVKVMVGVGGSFDYISGKIPRAPQVIQRLGFEWLFRLIIQPWRLKRQLRLLEFIFLVFKQKLKS